MIGMPLARLPQGTEATCSRCVGTSTISATFNAQSGVTGRSSTSAAAIPQLAWSGDQATIAGLIAFFDTCRPCQGYAPRTNGQLPSAESPRTHAHNCTGFVLPGGASSQWCGACQIDNVADHGRFQKAVRDAARRAGIANRPAPKARVPPAGRSKLASPSSHSRIDKLPRADLEKRYRKVKRQKKLADQKVARLQAAKETKETVVDVNDNIIHDVCEPDPIGLHFA